MNRTQEGNHDPRACWDPAATILMAASQCQAADLVVWWEKGFNAEEDDAVKAIAGAFQRKTGKEVELVLLPQQDLSGMLQGALDAGRPPDFAYSILASAAVPRWAHEGRLVDLTEAAVPMRAAFDEESLDRYTLLDSSTGYRGLFGLPLASATNNIHVWKSLLERTGLRLEDIPKQWEPF